MYEYIERSNNRSTFSTQAYLECLLAQSGKISEQQSELFDALCARSDTPIVLYGAGNLGAKLALILKDDGFQGKLVFTDSNPQKWGQEIHSIPVFPLADAAKQFGKKSLFIITIFNREVHCEYEKIVHNLSKIGIETCIPFSIPAWKYHHELLPHYLLGSYRDIFPYVNEIKKAFSLFTEQKSQRIFLDLMQVSLNAPINYISSEEYIPQYFIPEVLASLPKQLCIADCGAYDGDTLRDALDNIGPENIREYHAFEPDSVNFSKLECFVKTLGAEIRERIFCYNSAVGGKNGYVAIEQGNTKSACISNYNDDGIYCVSLDTIFHDKSCHFIKMDIEGFEEEALHGAKSLIKSQFPILAISSYHKPDDFFKLPLLIDEHKRTYRSMVLRRHMANLFETVLYCIH